MSLNRVDVPLAQPVAVRLGDEQTELTKEFVEAACLQIRVAKAGTGDPVVVLHHSTGPLWGEFHDCLAETNLVNAIDMPGYAESERPETARTPAHLAIVLHRALDRLGLERCGLVGLGFGGFVASEMVAINPNRYQSLVLVGSPGVRPREGEIHDWMTEDWTDYVRRCVSAETFDRLFGEDPSAPLVVLWDHSREMTARVAWKPWMWSLQLPQFLRGIDVPTLVVHGSEDRIVPLDCSRQFVELLPNSRLEIVDGAEHAVELERPAELVRLVTDFHDSLA